MVEKAIVKRLYDRAKIICNQFNFSKKEIYKINFKFQ